MTADKVTLRLNAVVTYRISDARKAVSQTDDVRQALYRESQLVLRAVVGARELDLFLTEKDAVAQEIEQAVRRRAGELGLEIASVGIRDVILPGDMKDLMNKVTEARKAADVVVVDTPPLLQATGSVALAPDAAAVILVARSGRTSADTASQAREILARVGATVLGVVLVAVPQWTVQQYYRRTARGAERTGALKWPSSAPGLNSRETE